MFLVGDSQPIGVFQASQRPSASISPGWVTTWCPLGSWVGGPGCHGHKVRVEMQVSLAERSEVAGPERKGAGLVQVEAQNNGHCPVGLG